MTTRFIALSLLLCLRHSVVQGWTLSPSRTMMAPSRGVIQLSTAQTTSYRRSIHVEHSSLQSPPRGTALSASTASASSDFSDQTFQQEKELRIPPETITSSTTNQANNLERLPFPIVLWKFSRPHTLVGSAVAIPALHMLAAPQWSAVWSLTTLQSILYAMLPAL